MTLDSLAPACSFSEEPQVLGSPEPPAGCWSRTASEPCPGESSVPMPCWCPRRPPLCSAVGQRRTAHGKSEAAKWPKAPSEASDGSLLEELGNCYMPYPWAECKHSRQVVLTGTQQHRHGTVIHGHAATARGRHLPWQAGRRPAPEL